MDFREICSFFGGSIFYEELRGDLKEIRARIDQEECDVSVECTSDERARILLLNAVWNLLSGNFKIAKNFLDDLIDGNYGPQWTFRAHAYIILHHTWYKHPPIFRTSSLKKGIGMNVLESQEGAKKPVSFQYCLDHIGELGLMESLEYGVIAETWCVYVFLYDEAWQENPASEEYEDSRSSSEERLEHLSEQRNALSAIQELFPKLGLEKIAAYIERLLAELAWAQGLAETETHIERMQMRYNELDDYHGLGLCELLKGDMLVSNPNTGPLVLNFQIEDKRV